MKSEDGFITIDRTKCIRCLECVRVCPSGALTVVGELRSVEEVVGEVLKDYEFYITSGGGVTLSGGEPLYQYKFSKAVMKRLKEVNIHTTLDTSGYALWEHFKEVLNYTDLILYDIKHMSPDKHKELTGIDNRLILENAKRCNDLGVPMIIRFPLIPSINDDIENLKELAKFIRSELNNVHQLDILPYHTLGIPKYEMLGKEYPLKNLHPPSMEDMRKIIEILRSFGLSIKINVVI
jgi:pyruvate formate lyase activating enzyme